MRERESISNQDLEASLRALPELTAPPTLVDNVLAEIRRREQRPWHRQPWQCWSPALRIASLAMLLAVTSLIGFGLWQLLQSPAVSLLSSEVTSASATLDALWNTLAVVGKATVLIAKHAAPGILIGLLAVAGVSYLLCIGAGTLVVRYAFARR